MPIEQNGEPGWLAGEIRGHTGWFPESYVEPIDKADINRSSEATLSSYTEEAETKHLECVVLLFPCTFNWFLVFFRGIAEENTEVPSAVVEQLDSESMEPEFYVANYPYQSIEQGDLSFNAGDVVSVLKKEGDWWTGKLGDVVGIFPSNYVQKLDAVSILQRRCAC